MTAEACLAHVLMGHVNADMASYIICTFPGLTAVISSSICAFKYGVMGLIALTRCKLCFSLACLRRQQEVDEEVLMHSKHLCCSDHCAHLLHCMGHMSHLECLNKHAGTQILDVLMLKLPTKIYDKITHQAQ